MGFVIRDRYTLFDHFTIPPCHDTLLDFCSKPRMTRTAGARHKKQS